MKKILLFALVATAVYLGYGNKTAYRPSTQPPAAQGDVAESSSADDIAAAYRSQQSRVQVQGEGVVSKVLPDDNNGSRHQSFIIKLSSGQTVLVAHNIDLAPRVEALKPGDTVAFNGEYEWNAKGGVVHWTHLDPAGRHEAGWLRHAGKTYQ